MPSGRFKGAALAMAVPLVACGMGWLASLTPLGSLAEWRTVDLRFKVRGPIVPEPEVLIIAVDEGTFRTLGLKYPFPPIVFAKLLDRLREAQAAVVAFDFLYSEPSRECNPPDQDRLLAQAAKAFGNAVWALQWDEEGKKFIEPIPLIGDSAAGIGFVNLPDEWDGRIRRLQPAKEGRLAFAPAIVQAYAGFVPPRWQLGGLVPINFRGPAGTFPSVSLGDVIQGRVPPDRLRGKVCLVGATFVASHDLYATPFHETKKDDMPGVEIHANAVGNMLRGDTLSLSPLPLYWLALLVLCAACAAIFVRGGPWWALTAWVVCSASWFGWSLFRFLRHEITPLAVPMAVLAVSFWGGAFVQHLAERNQRLAIHNLFNHYVDPMAINWLLKHPERLQLKGVRRTVTILDTDIEGFTSITQSLDPAVLVDLLNEYFEAITDAALAAGGMHDKFVGDAIMVIFGFPMEQPDHALRALSAAQEILRRVEVLNKDLKERGLPALNTRIGICSGDVVIGSVGGTKRKAFTAMGDAANLASRLEGLNKRFGTRVLLSDSTARLLPPGIPLRDMGAVQVRGISAPMGVFNPTFDSSITSPGRADESQGRPTSESGSA